MNIVVTGFLGSGKTETLKAILPQLSGSVTVIENEIGDFGVDGKRFDVNVIEINSGSISDVNLGIFKRTVNEIKTDWIVVETSGAAGINEVLSVLGPSIVVCVIDAQKFEKVTKLSEKTLDHIKNASVVLLNKSDLVHNCKKLIKYLSHLNSNVLLTSYGKVDISGLKTIKGKNKIKYQLPYLLWRIKNNLGLTKEVNALTYVSYGIMDIEQLQSYLGHNGILRAKGFIKTNHGNYEVSYVNNTFNAIKTKFKGPNRIVLIDNNIFSKRRRFFSDLNKMNNRQLKDKIKNILIALKGHQNLPQRIIHT